MSPLQRIFTIIIVVFFLIGFSIAAGCTSPAKSSTSTPGVASYNSTVERVEVFHFHRTQQCPSCIAIGNLTEKTLKANFQKELASGRLVFAHVGYELPENAALAAKYGVTGSSLWIGVYDANGFHNEENIKVWYLISNKDAYSTYLTDLIAKRLTGDFS
ncbi:MAG: nitrophenyl compound nitroreductase subunit ArsF family protein [Methanoregula sp.]|nr:nitrophenyl compound nitroreductase subunit ArsF family protein [Methanoregula sp.]